MPCLADSRIGHSNTLHKGLRASAWTTCTGYLEAWAPGDSTLWAVLGRYVGALYGNAGDDWHQRVEQLIDVLRETPRKRTLIFVNSLHNCHVLLHFFRDNGWPVVSFMKGPRGRMGL
ncbi:SCN10A [Symbiodinium sp. CCMP2592]|nr:SCN10A [Symbiodinium sp. CCMP2592]